MSALLSRPIYDRHRELCDRLASHYDRHGYLYDRLEQVYDRHQPKEKI